MNQWKLDRKIREIAQSGEIPYPKDYSERMKNLCDNLPEDTGIPKETGRFRLRYGMLFLTACLAMVAAPASAEIQQYHQRLEAMEEEEKERLVSGVQESKADGDTYTRDLTNSELERMEQLTQSYEAGDAYPTGEVTSIDEASQWKGDQLCFVTDISTFFFPVRDLTDEELLEIIDFYYKRDYSLAESQQETNAAPVEMTKKEHMKRAKELGREYIQKMFRVDLSQETWEVKTKIVEENKGGNSRYYIHYTQNDTQAEYEAVFYTDTWSLGWINCEYDGEKENIGPDVPLPSEKELREVYNRVKEVAESMGCVSEVKKAYCEYTKSEKKQLKNGVETFFMEEKDGSGWGARYSIHSGMIYELFHLNDVSAYQKARKEQDGLALIRARLDDFDDEPG